MTKIRKAGLAALTVAALLPTLGRAATPPGKPAHTAPVAASAHPSVTNMTCREFTQLDERLRPTVVGYAVAYDRRGKPLDSVVDVEGIEQATPVLVKSCRAAPEQTFISRLRADFDHLMHRG